jgi:hypothetical protein
MERRSDELMRVDVGGALVSFVLVCWGERCVMADVTGVLLWCDPGSNDINTNMEQKNDGTIGSDRNQVVVQLLKNKPSQTPSTVTISAPLTHPLALFSSLRFPHSPPLPPKP